MLRPGFTLLEVVVAVTVAGVAVTAAVALLMGMSGQAEAIEAAALRIDRDANAERVLRELLRNLDTGSTERPSLEGDSRYVRFRTWCRVTGEAADLCAVRLFVDKGGGGASVGYEWSVVEPVEPVRQDARSLQLWTGLGEARLLYLLDAARGGMWGDVWSGITVPGAVGVVMDSDTLILRVR